MNRWHRYRERIQTLASKPITPAVILALRKEFDEATAYDLVQVASLQSKAVKKFGEGVWMVTERAIEQASERTVAAYKASLLSAIDVIDLCGGVGGDAMAFAAQGRVITVDREPQMTSMATENLRSAGAQSAAAVCADSEQFMRHLGLASKRCGIHIDPDRRVGNRRTVAPSDYSPGLDAVMKLAESSRQCWIKLAPAAELPDELSRAHHRQWISYSGSVREQALMCGDLTTTGTWESGARSAVRVLRDGTTACFIGSTPSIGSSQMSASSTLAYLFDFDPAIRAAGLSEAFARTHSLCPMSDASGFFTSDQLPESTPLLQAFKTVWAGPADLKLIKKELSKFKLNLQTVKVRGSDHAPERLLKQLKPVAAPEGSAAALLIGRGQGHVFAAIAIPVLASVA